jgi:hypothetical protein
LCLSQDDRPLPGADVDESFRQRETYQQGSSSRSGVRGLA